MKTGEIVALSGCLIVLMMFFMVMAMFQTPVHREEPIIILAAPVPAAPSQVQAPKAVPTPPAVNVSSRGEPGPYQQMGVLYSDDEPERKVLPLYGRQTYPGSQAWNYYTKSDGYDPVQLSIRQKNRDCLDLVGCPELDTGDKVPIPEMGGGVYTFKKYPNAIPRYLL